MKPRLFLVVKNPFTVRDYGRMGIDLLRQHFDLMVLDCSPWLMPQSSKTRDTAKVPNGVTAITIGSMADLRLFLKGVSAGFVIDYVGQFSINAIRMFDALKRKGLKLVVVDSGSFPLPKEWNRLPTTFLEVIYAIKSRLLIRGAKGIARRLLLLALPNQDPDIALVSGDSWKSNRRFASAPVKIPSHSFDREVFQAAIDMHPVRQRKYAVYIDEKLPFHEDNVELGYPPPVTLDRFRKALRHFFDEFELATGLPIVVAAYPTADVDSLRDLVGNRDVVYGKTAELIVHSDIVFAHTSTAISYAVLARRPIIYLTTPEYRSSWLFPWQDAPRRLLNAKLFDMETDVLSPEQANSWREIDTAAYASYETKHIRSENFDGKSMWDGLVSYVLGCDLQEGGYDATSPENVCGEG